MRESPIPCGPGLRWAGGVERSRATGAASSGGKQVRPAEPLGLQSRVAAGDVTGGGPLSAALTLIT